MVEITPGTPQTYEGWRREIADQVSAWIGNIPFRAELNNGNVKLVRIHPPEGLQQTADNGERV